MSFLPSPARRVAAVLLPVLVSAACFSSETVIRVKADGSGSIEQTNLANSQMLGMASGMAQAAAKESGSTAALGTLDINGLFDEASLEKQAATWGPGVRFVSSEKLSQGAMQGAKALFAFDDVRKLTLGGQTSAGGATTGVPGPNLRFELEGSGPYALRVIFPDQGPGGPGAEAAAPAAKPPADIPPEALAMVKAMFAGARISVALDVDGTIVNTDAPARDGSRVTLFAMDLEQLLADPSKFAALQSLKPGADIATVRRQLEGVPGITLPVNPTVTVHFRK
jgi:hypothetical protein